MDQGAHEPASAHRGGGAAQPPVGLDRNTLLAMERNRLAEERTLMAWLRTSLALIGFGISLVKFVEWTEEHRGWGPAERVRAVSGTTRIGLLMLLIGTVALLLAVWQHRIRLRGLQAMGLEPRWDLAAAVATVVAILGAVSFVTLCWGL